MVDSGEKDKAWQLANLKLTNWVKPAKSQEIFEQQIASGGQQIQEEKKAAGRGRGFVKESWGYSNGWGQTTTKPSWSGPSFVERYPGLRGTEAAAIAEATQRDPITGLMPKKAEAPKPPERKQKAAAAERDYDHVTNTDETSEVLGAMREFRWDVGPAPPKARVMDSALPPPPAPESVPVPTGLSPWEEWLEDGLRESLNAPERQAPPKFPEPPEKPSNLDAIVEGYPVPFRGPLDASSIGKTQENAVTTSAKGTTLPLWELEKDEKYVGVIRLIPQLPPPAPPPKSSNKIVPKFQKEIFGPMVVPAGKGYTQPDPIVKAPAPAPEAEKLLEKEEDEPLPSDCLASASPHMRKMLDLVEKRFTWPSGKKERFFLQLKSQMLHDLDSLLHCTPDEWAVLGWAFTDFEQVQAVLKEMFQDAPQDAETVTVEVKNTHDEVKEVLARTAERFDWPPGKMELYMSKLREQWLLSVTVLSSVTQEDWRVLKWPLDVFFEVNEILQEFLKEKEEKDEKEEFGDFRGALHSEEQDENEEDEGEMEEKKNREKKNGNEDKDQKEKQEQDEFENK